MVFNQRRENVWDMKERGDLIFSWGEVDGTRGRMGGFLKEACPGSPLIGNPAQLVFFLWLVKSLKNL